MRIFITGISGLLGYSLFEALKENNEIYGCSLHNQPENLSTKRWVALDIADQKKTYDVISKINPEIVIHTAALADVDYCETNPEKAYKLNSLGTRNIALACQRFDTVLCYISTDYVFDGEDTSSEGYTELDKTNPLSVYAKSKYLGEFYVKHLLNKFYIVRTAWLFGKRRDTFIDRVIEAVKEQKEIKIVEDQSGSSTYTKDLAEAVAQLIDKPLYGVYHLTNSGGTNRKDMVEEIFSILKKSTKTVLSSRKEVYSAPRPKDTRLKNLVWETEGFTPLRLWKEAVREYILEKQI